MCIARARVKTLAHIGRSISGRYVRLPALTRRFSCASTSSTSDERLHSALYLVATPIGNLEDITLRALRILKGADVIFCEDCRHTRKLLSHFGILTSLESLHQHNEVKRSARVVELLERGNAVALVSDAGTPGISDPGTIAVAAAVANGFTVVPVPGPCAVVTGLIASGLPTDKFVFIGFLPPKPGARKSELALLRRTVTATMVFYVPPHKLQATLEDMQEVFGGARRCCVAREVTKKFEEFLRGTIEDVLQGLNGSGVKGEVTLLVEGSSIQDVNAGDQPQMSKEKRLQELLGNGCSTGDASKIVASEYNMRKKDAYSIALTLQRSNWPPTD